MTDFGALLTALVRGSVRFVVVGGAAGRPQDLEAIAELEEILAHPKP